MTTNSNKLRVISIALAIIGLVLMTTSLSMKYYEGKQKDEIISNLQKQNKELNMQLIEINKEINEANLQNKIQALDWEPDQELKGILSMTPTEYMTLYDINLQISGEELVKSHLKTLVEAIPYVGGYSLDRYPKEQEIGLTTEDYGRYDLVFYVDVGSLEELRTQNPQKYDKIVEELSKHGVVGF